eukprot:TRINITY_DN252_c0_g1_i1.p1 TRINITY_DN252_c0_g1~~TRINITY_DN252_c0_g1_i1.p1  ORF type:complete len:534 (-),score=98.39 TRINITY_DN252_c0_g1_i1:100-1587(-)
MAAAAATAPDLEPAMLSAPAPVPFLWPLLPPFLERPAAAARMAAASRGLGRCLRDGGRLRVGHLLLHPNTLGPYEAWRDLDPASLNARGSSASSSSSASPASVEPACGEGAEPEQDGAVAKGASPARRVPGQASSPVLRRSCLQQVALGSLVTVQFHLPRLLEAFHLLGLLCGGTCCLLRKIVDRQSRWRPREQRYESLDAEGRERAADLADNLGIKLRSLRHVEGPIFALLLRARAARRTGGGGGGGAAEEAAEGSDAPPRQGLHEAGSGGGCNGAAACQPLDDGNAEPRGLGGRAETIHMVDVLPTDLLGLWEACCPRLKKLVLLNLPSAAPGRTALAIAAFLPKAPALSELQLDFQFFDPSAWDLEALQELVSRVQLPPSKLTKLALEWCRLGDAGVSCVCRTLARHPRKDGGLTELSLAHSELRDIGSVCEMLEAPGLALTKLDLSSNGLEDCQAERLAESLPLSGVKELRLRDTQISIPLPVKVEWFWGA